MSEERTEREELRNLMVDLTIHATGDRKAAQRNGELLEKMVAEECAKAAFHAANNHREVFQNSLGEAVREVSERVWGEAVAACAEQGTIQIPENPYTLEAIEKRKREEAEGFTD